MQYFGKSDSIHIVSGVNWAYGLQVTAYAL
jgi:hypothetical protein